MNDLKDKIAYEFIHQNSNDPIISPVLESEYGSIEVRFEYHVGNGIETIGKVKVFPKGDFNTFAHTSSCLIEEGEFETNGNVVETLHDFILRYLDQFEADRSLMENHGFKTMGYDWYQFNDLNVVKLLKHGNQLILIGTPIDDFRDAEWNDFDEDEFDLMKTLVTYAKDLNHYLLLPPKLRDELNAVFVEKTT